MNKKNSLTEKKIHKNKNIIIRKNIHKTFA